MDYVVAVQAPAYALSAHAFATESAFAEHLREVRARLPARFTRLVLLAPAMPVAAYEAARAHLGTVDEARDGVAFEPLHPADTDVKAFWTRHVAADVRTMARVLSRAGALQTGLSDDTYKPFMALLNAMAFARRVPVMFIVDIDYRENAARNHALGVWSRRSFLSNKLVHDPLRNLQVAMAPFAFQLVLLKSDGMVRDFGRGRDNVKSFYDTVHAPSDVLSGSELAARRAFVSDPARPLTLAFFGRYVPYKGLDRTLEALAHARAQGSDVRLVLIGSGPEEPRLRALAAELGLAEAVRFEGQVPYGPALFERLRDVHAALSTPLREDTPRSAFDAMARGLPVLAFDIAYFRDLAQHSGAVVTSPWPDVQALGEHMVALDRDRPRLAALSERAVAFARDNTQAIWVKRRAEWVERYLTKSRGPADGSAPRSRRDRSA
jgi:glycosyltransferase involved in cell wall biosynthesis